ncbi:MAG TPA: hypothetical protein VM537_37185 [Anaerolineae bacterium]|nr:hypothetical protein [Anaerolineae bacterium]
MRKSTTLLFTCLIMLLMLTGIVSADGPTLGAFSTTGYMLAIEAEPLPNGQVKFHLLAKGGGETQADEALCAGIAAFYGIPIPNPVPVSICDSLCRFPAGLPCGAAGFFHGPFSFEEWGIADPITFSGANYGVLSVAAANGTAQIQFDGAAAGGFVQGGFTVLSGSRAYKKLQGQGIFGGNAGPVFTVQYVPCGAPGSNDCPPAPACHVSGDGLRMTEQVLGFKLVNHGDVVVTIDSITIFWPDGNGRLKKVSFDERIYNHSLAPTWATIASGWAGDDDDRELEKGETKTLEFQFQNPVSTEPSDYIIQVDFAEGCSALAVAFPEP